uniref:Uncharacterized protein n=1 Tax=Amphimedon queenslandica TaxID=400682 RepID=A0A1X7UZC6_AMPQE
MIRGLDNFVKRLGSDARVQDLNTSSKDELEQVEFVPSSKTHNERDCTTKRRRHDPRRRADSVILFKIMPIAMKVKQVIQPS